MSTPPSVAPNVDSCHTRRGLRLRALALGLLPAIALAILLGAGPASAAYIHPEATYSFGPDGTGGTTFGSGDALAFNQANQRLYALDKSPRKIHGFTFNSPGSFTPLGGSFPLEVEGGGGDPDLAVDNSGNDNIIYIRDGNEVESYTASGGAGPGFSPPSGEKCGAAVDSEGHVWVGNYGGSAVLEFAATGGAPINTVSVGAHGRPCHVEIDRATDDLYVSYYSPNFGHGVDRYTKASGYSLGSDTVFMTGNNNKIAINAVKHRLYVARPNGAISAFDTETASEVESFDSGQHRGIAVDDATDTVFVMKPNFNNQIQEWKGVIVPDVTTGEPVGNSEVSASVGLSGGGEVLECYFEFGTSPNPGSFGPTHPLCEPNAPYGSDQALVTAELPGLEGETTYYYRAVAVNANGTGRGSVKSITPHNVKVLKTEPADEITRTTATLNATYEGTSEETHYYFEWEAGPGACPCENLTATPPGDVEGPTVGLTELSTPIAGLTAGTTYHFRVVAENSLGISRGSSEEFVTSPAVKDLETKPATEVEPGSATLNGSLDPDGYETTFYFEWGKTEGYGQAVPLPPGEDVGTTAPGTTPVSAGLTGLEEGITYHYRIVGVNETGETRGLDETFTTPQAPSITSFSSTNVAADSADLVATVNPNGFATTYYFEYGTTATYGSKAPAEPAVGELPAESTVQSIVEPISGLRETTYHFRLVATNEWGTSTTEDQTFDFKAPSGCPNHTLRQQTRAAYLPDCRAYEIVSASNAGGAALLAEGPTTQYASSPGRFAYGGLLNSIPGAGEPLNSNLFTSELYVATRTNTGWFTKYVGIPGYQSLEQSSAPGGEYTSLPSGAPIDRNMNHFLIWDRAQSGLIEGGPLQGTNAPYVYDNEGNLIKQLPTNVAEVPGSDTDLSEGGFMGASRINPSFTHYVFSSNNLAFATEGLIEAPGSAYDNDLGDETVTLISKTHGGGDIPHDPGSPAGEDEFLRIPAISDDGSHILMAAGAPGPVSSGIPTLSHLYMSVDDTLHYDISLDKTATNVGVKFESMTADGTRVFFTTNHQMTPDDTDSSIDLYMWNAETDSLTRVSDSGNVPGNSDACSASWTSQCNVEVVTFGNSYSQQANRGRNEEAIAKETGEIYFYSPEQLDGARGFPNARNLFVYREGRPQHVVSLEASEPAENMNVSPDGRYMSLITRTQATAYDNSGYLEMYLYDAEARTLKCVSCAPSGAPPTDDVQGALNGHFMTFDGRTFFATRDSLTPRDANGIIDVYEFVGGRAQLISTGTGDNAGNPFQPAGLVGVSGDGTDAFIATYETLVPQDENGGQLKFYDARTNGGFPFSEPSPPCEAADECHGADSSPPSALELGTRAPLGSGGNFSQESDCKSLARRAKKNSNRAKSLRRKAKKAQGKRARALRRKAKRSAKQARKLSKKAKSCRRSSGGNG